MSARLETALAELAAAIREEVALAAVHAVGRPPELLAIPEAGRRLGGIGRTLVYGLIERGDLRSVKVAGRRLVPADAIADLINEKGAGLTWPTPREVGRASDRTTAPRS